MSEPVIDLGKLERDPAPAKPKRKRTERDRERDRERRRAGAASSRAPLEVRIRESLEAVAGWVADRGDVELGEILERDAPKMAAVLGKVANMNPVAKRAVGVLADVLEPVRAFGPTLRLVWYRFLTRRAERGELEPPGDEEVVPFVPLPGGPEPSAPGEPPEPEVAEPWRLDE